MAQDSPIHFPPGVRESLIYERAAPVDALLRDVRSLAVMDRHFERLQSRWSNLGCVGVLALLGAGIGGAVAMDNVGEELGVPLLLVTPLALVFLIVAFVKSSRYGRYNVEDRRYQLVDAVLPLLGADVAPDERLRVRLDLRRPDAGEKYRSKGTVNGWDVSYYEDPWLTLAGRLVDGTAFELGLVEHYQARSRWKRNPRGKLKKKTKSKSTTVARLELRPKTKRYGDPSALARDARGAVKLPPYVALKGLDVSGDGLELKAQLKGEWAAAPRGDGARSGQQMVALMFLSLYQVLNLSREMTRREGGSA